MGMKDYFHGTALYSMEGADPEGCLNRLNQEGIPLWKVDRRDSFFFTFIAPLGMEGQILSIGEKAYCEGRVLERRGMKEDGKKMLRRPFLILSFTVAILLTFLMDSLVWKIQIDAGSSDTEWTIRHVLRDLGVDIWTKTENIDPQELRYALLNEIPDLSWVAVNPKGGKVSVLAMTKQETGSTEDHGPRNLVAVRDAVITESVVTEGMPLAKVGDSVKEGQILISGVEDYGLYMKAVRAEGEIYGQTWYKGTLVTPSQRWEKRYTDHTRQEIFIIFGRKSIKLSGSSSNLGVSCDKIIDTKQLSPPGCTFPLYLQRVTYREYVLQELPMPQEVAQELLCRSWGTCLLSSMVAGQLRETDFVCFEKGGLYIFQGESICYELLSRPMPLEPPQKGADPIGTDH